MDGKKILVVDDEPDILEILSYNLRKEGFQVQTANNGEEGLKAAHQMNPDLIILDIMMPQMDGVEVCRQLRSMPSFDNTLIAFLTAKEEDQSQISALDFGGDDYITKPIKPKVLMSRVKALLRRNQKTDENTNEFRTVIGDLIIDRESYRVTKGGVEVELAKKEFELLNLLASKPGRVFTRNEIYDKIWGSEVIVGDRTIDVYIRKLREKLGDDFIKTIKGIGYRFEF
ncbi:MAG: response regulator transcription factor [Saprospiraceae bacterium]|jgi:two-component system alkaline phosphatase synthesis response regulator PhoP|nr:response regulator transcription factor [Saprospiraceae bacterium]